MPFLVPEINIRPTEVLMTAKYIISKSSTRDVDKINAWYSHCQAHRLPYITITTRTKYANVEWDYINLPMEIDAVISTNENRLLDGFKRIYLKYANPKSVGRLSNHVPQFINIEIDKAELLASDLYDFITEVLGLSPLVLVTEFTLDNASPNLGER